MQSKIIRDTLHKLGTTVELPRIFDAEFPGGSPKTGIGTEIAANPFPSPAETEEGFRDAITKYQRRFFRFHQHGSDVAVDTQFVRLYDDHLEGFYLGGPQDSYERVISTLEYASLRAIQVISRPLTETDIFCDIL